MASNSSNLHLIPDGEYGLEISDVLQSLLFAKSPTPSSSSRSRNNEVLSISFDEPQTQQIYGMDLSKPFLLTREPNEETFTMATDSTKIKAGLTLKGDIKPTKTLNSILVFNPASGVFELQQIENELSTLEIKETQEEKKREDTPPQRPTPPPSSTASAAQLKSPLNNTASVKKRVHKEPSIFQPKARARTPSQGAASLPKPKIKLTRDNSTTSASGDSPPATIPENVERSLPPSPLTYNMTTAANNKTSETGSPMSSHLSGKRPLTPEYSAMSKIVAPKPIVAAKKQPIETASFPKTSNKRPPPPAQYGSKKPPSSTSTSKSTATTPTPTPTINTHDETARKETTDSDDELDDLADELEDELELQFDDFGEDEDSKNSNFITVEEDAPISMDFHFGDDDDMIIDDSNAKRPISFRDLVGGDDDRQDEDALSSSSEEE